MAGKDQPVTQRVEPKSKAQVWIYFRGKSGLKVLILKTRTERGGFWQPVTGGVEPGEAPVEGALREAQEETGLSFIGAPQALDYVFKFTRPHWTDPACTLDVTEHAFALEAASGPDGEAPKVKMDPHEHVDCEWVGVVEAGTRIRFDSNRHALETLQSFLARR